MHRRILPEGLKSARIIIIGEAPDKSSTVEGRPFAGQTGQLLRKWWDYVGLSRNDFFIDYLYPHKPTYSPNPKDKLMLIPVDEIVQYMRNLHIRMTELTDPYVIVPFGNYATFALLGKGKVPARIYKEIDSDVTGTEAEKKAGITQLRGSIYEYRDMNGRVIKVIPMIPPEDIFGMIKWEERCVKDWKRVKGESEFKECKRLRRNTEINPVETDVQEFIKESVMGDKKIAIDIETWGNQLTCIGFANSPTNSITLKTPNKEKRARWMPWIVGLCGLPNQKVLQNGFFDCYWLQFGYKVWVNNFIWDTLYMHHCVNPRESHDLAFLASIYTDQIYYKDEAKNAEEIRKYTKSLDALWVYNGLDCCVTWEIERELEKELSEIGKLEQYFKHYVGLYEPLIRMMLTGFRVDTKAQKGFEKVLKEECVELRRELKELAGEELYTTEWKSKNRNPTVEEWERLLSGSDFNRALISDGEIPPAKEIHRPTNKELNYVMSKGVIKEKYEVLKKDFSLVKLKRFFYETLGAPEQKNWDPKKKKKTVTIDIVALKKLVMYHHKKVGDAPLKVIQHRKKMKEAQIFKGAWDRDGRVRCEYTLNLEAYRLASRANPMRKGYNLQNIKRGYPRSTFKADDGCVMIRVDMSQDEHRRCLMYTGQERLVKIANLRADEYDGHTANAADIFGVSESDVSKEQRYLGKKVVHGAERNMMGKTMSESLLKEDIIVSPKECQKLLEVFHKKTPEIRKFYFPWVQSEFMGNKKLVNNWGREIQFNPELSMGRLDETIWNKLYSFPMQSDCACNLNQNGVIPGHWWMWRELGKALNAQVHDEIIACVPPERAWDFVSFIVPLLEREREYFGHTLSVPAEVTIGKDWEDGRFEFKRLPSRGEFEEVVYHVWEEIKNEK